MFSRFLSGKKRTGYSGSRPPQDVPESASFNKDPIYQPLAPNETRLLRMNHTETQDIECEVVPFVLHERPDYLALSYLWTAAQPCHQIRLNGSIRMVRPNLYDWLKMMRLENESRWIFIDALCIDQTDPAERSAQVKLMGNIYANSKETIAWMGVTNRSAREAASDLSNELCIKLQKICDSEEGLRTVIPRFPQFQKFGEGGILLCKAFLFNDYWTRVWTVQEMVLAPKLILRFGKLTMPGEHIRILTDCFQVGFAQRDERPLYLAQGQPSYLGSEMHAMVNHIQIAQLLSMRDRLHYEPGFPGRMTLLSAVLSASVQQCGYTLDRVYGVLGMTNAVLEPRYDQSHLELYLRTFLEGMLEFNVFNRPFSGDEEIGKHLKLEMDFCSVLLFALKLDFYNPVVFLTIDFANDLLTKHFKRSPTDWLERCFAEFHLNNGDPKFMKMSFEERLDRVKSRTKATKKEIEAATRKNHLMPLPGDTNDARLYRDWKRYVQNIFEDVASHEVNMYKRCIAERSAIFKRRVYNVYAEITGLSVDDEALAGRINPFCRDIIRASEELASPDTADIGKEAYARMRNDLRHALEGIEEADEDQPAAYPAAYYTTLHGRLYESGIGLR